MNLEEMHTKHKEKNWGDYEWKELPWKAWGSWFSWGSATGFGFFLISVGVFLVLLHLANIIH